VGAAPLEVTPPLLGLLVQDDDLDPQLVGEVEDAQLLQDDVGIAHATPLGQGDVACARLLESGHDGAQGVGVRGGREGIRAVVVGLEGCGLAGEIAQAGFFQQKSGGLSSVLRAGEIDVGSVLGTHLASLLRAASP
jgi:hypothetical protein